MVPNPRCHRILGTKRIAFDNYQRIWQDRTQEKNNIGSATSPRCGKGAVRVTGASYCANLVTVLPSQRNEQIGIRTVVRTLVFLFFFPLRSQDEEAWCFHFESKEKIKKVS